MSRMTKRSATSGGPGRDTQGRVKRSILGVRRSGDKTVFGNSGGSGDDGMRPKHIRVIADRYTPLQQHGGGDSYCGTSVTAAAAAVQYIVCNTGRPFKRDIDTR